jgi:acyl carrier protein
MATQVNDSIIENELRDIVAQVVEADREKITLDADFIEDLGMDSMMALEIMAAIEKKYKIRISEEKLAKLRNLRESIALTKEYL